MGLCKVRPIGAITKGETGEQLADVGEMKKAGAVAISDDGVTVKSSRLMRLAMEYASGFDIKCLCHCEDKELVDGGVVNEGFSSTVAGLKGSPRAAEDIIIAREIALAESLDVPVHICHVSTYSGVRMIRDAKRAGIKVTAETCPHYYSFTDEIIKTYDTNTKVNPPIREEVDKQAILAGLQDGTIDCIVTDHAPHHTNDKNVEYNLAAFGISGIETSFGFAITYLYKTGVLDLPAIAEKMSAAPARILKLDGGEIAEGKVADFTIANLDEKWTVEPENFVSKGKNNPFKGWELSGVVKYTVVDGEIKYQRYACGQFVPAYKKSASFENERHAIGLDNGRIRIMVSQVAGLLARRLVSWVTLGNTVQQGECYGMIKFGSSTELVVPKNVEICVKKYQKVTGGVTIVGRIKD